MQEAGPHGRIWSIFFGWYQIHMRQVAKLALADGTVYTGWGWGASGEVFGEIVFNTSLTGYQEILTDPSYCGQIVTMTYPLIGNYGVNPEDVESHGLSLRGFIIRELCEVPSNFRSTESLDSYLRRAGVIGLEGIDTRSLVRRLRTQGAMNGVLSTVDLDNASLIAKAQSSPSIVGQDLVSEVMPKEAFAWTENLASWAPTFTAPTPTVPTSSDQRPLKVVAVDYGMKHNILRHLTQANCQVTVVPGNSTAEQILAHQPDGRFAWPCEPVRRRAGGDGRLTLEVQGRFRVSRHGLARDRLRRHRVA